MEKKHSRSIALRAAVTMQICFPTIWCAPVLAIAPKLGLPVEASHGERLRNSAASWKFVPDDAAELVELARSYNLITMTNAWRWAFEHFSAALGHPFHASFTADDTGTEKPDLPSFKGLRICHGQWCQ
ncbi:exported hypothetical protein [Agrobacterium tumefaciens str. Kerr 14]|uniref:Uncharacterized protein n=1 Tax=Agrobacterium tumefaciens str. Kerr 14 TaxID=1183424 RepID=A0A1S7SC13_AGRTU|nr:exported hypothetical protein [Agrobacterium tumefaciens str. Kerr 14]